MPVRTVETKPVRTLLRARAWGERVQMGVVKLRAVVMRFMAAATTCLVLESRTGSDVVFIVSLFLSFFPLFEVSVMTVKRR
jgi:hypothetical protein